MDCLHSLHTCKFFFCVNCVNSWSVYTFTHTTPEDLIDVYCFCSCLDCQGIHWAATSCVRWDKSSPAQVVQMPQLMAAFLSTKRVFHQDLQLVETEDLLQHIQLNPAVLSSFPEGTVLHVRRKVSILHSIVCSSYLHQLGLPTVPASPASIGGTALKVPSSSHPFTTHFHFHTTQCKSNGNGNANNKVYCNGSASAGANGNSSGNNLLHSGPSHR